MEVAGAMQDDDVVVVIDSPCMFADENARKGILRAWVPSSDEEHT